MEIVPFPNDGTILVSHLDLDTIGGIAKLVGDDVADYHDFWQVAAYKDVHGAHKVKQASGYTNVIGEQLDAYHAWAETNRQPRQEGVSDVTEQVGISLTVIDEILNNDPARLEFGREWRKCLDDLDVASLISQHGRILVRVSDKFTNALYREDADIIIAFSTTHKTITLSTAEKIHGFDCAVFLSNPTVLGPKAGGRQTIAGSPRGKKMTFIEFSVTVKMLLAAIAHRYRASEIDSL